MKQFLRDYIVAIRHIYFQQKLNMRLVSQIIVRNNLHYYITRRTVKFIPYTYYITLLGNSHKITSAGDLFAS